MNKIIPTYLTACLLLFLFSCNKNSITDDEPLQNDASSNAVQALTSKKFLFDNTKAETAGNADWVIDEDNNVAKQKPTPSSSKITATTTESFWTGALSSWGVALVKQGQKVETLPSTGRITYKDSTNAQDLSKYTVYVVDEPNIQFTAAEKTAIINYVKNGGGLFMISDHNNSDRNNDGWDSPAIWNDLMNNNSVQNNPFGFSIDLTDISGTTSNVTSTSNKITQGSQGTVSSLVFHDGATITLNNSAAVGLIWQNGYAQNTTHVMCAYSTYGKGRVFVITDSSPADDGTGGSGHTLYNGWTELGNNHVALHMNASLWLAKLQ